MSVFDYPRINFTGRLRLNPGTANNEDYAQPGPGQALITPSLPPYTGEAMGLLTTESVETRRFGMSDGAFVDWIQRFQEFDAPDLGMPQRIMPAEWNYYGDMSSTAVDIEVVGVQTEPGSVHTQAAEDIPLTSVLGATLSFYGNITDVNPEGSPPATQFFVDQLELSARERRFISGGQVSKGVGLWINFFRNVNKTADDGAGTYVHHVIRDADIDLPGFEDCDGVVMRYYLSLPLLDDPSTSCHDVLEQYYRDRRQNPKTLEVVGTFSPYHDGEPIAMPPGRQLISTEPNVPTPHHTHNNAGGNGIALAPAVAHQDGNWLSVDFSGTFPDAYVDEDHTQANPKFDLGALRLCVVVDDERTVIASVDYLDLDAGNACGWLFDFDLSRGDGVAALGDPAARLQLVTDDLTVVLGEVEYYVVTDQLAVYAEQHGPDDRFISQGTEEPISISIYHRGVELAADDCPPVSMWTYRSVPIQSPGDAELQTDALRPGEPLRVSTVDAGATLATFRVEGETTPPAVGFPPTAYGSFAYPQNSFVVTWAPQISVRVLPTFDYSEYFVDASSSEPVGNDLLTWDVVYDEVLRTYALLYPAMRNKFALDDPDEVARFAPYIIAATSPDRWMSSRYMPPTRDLSASRRRLLQAWCRKSIALGVKTA